MEITAVPYQREFLFSTARYPTLKCGWGTGKTMMGIMKIYTLAQMYRDNLLLICRENYTNLKNSTMADFMQYTGQRVKVGAKTCELPNGTVILFSHADDVAGVVQNINLGGFLIEQAEEFASADVFTMLSGGRLRRKLELDDRWWDQLDLDNPNADLTPESRAFYEYCRSEHEIEVLGKKEKVFGLRQGINIANANGRNWIWSGWKRDGKVVRQEDHWCRRENSKRPTRVMWEADSYANAENLPADFRAGWEEMKNGDDLEQRKYRIYILNLDEESDLEGAFYAKLMGEARTEGRIGSYPPDPSHETHTAWDIGVTSNAKAGDSTAIWFFQKIGSEIRHIHYHECASEGAQYYVRYVKDIGKRMNLVYGKHFWPFDGKRKEWATGDERRKTARDMGLDVTSLDCEIRVATGIERTRKMLPYCTYDETECRRGIEALEHYHRRKNKAMSTDEKTSWIDVPVHDWASDGADAERYVSMAAPLIGQGTPENNSHVEELSDMYRGIYA